MVKRYLFIICILSMSLTLSAGMKDSKPNFWLTIHLPGIEDSVQIRMMEKENTWSAPSLLIARHGKAKTKFHLSEPVQMVLIPSFDVSVCCDSRRAYGDQWRCS